MFKKNKSCKKIALTLAEILITLGIIGLVASMTIPVIISNVQKNILENQSKVTYSKFTNAFKLMMAKEQVSSLSDTSAFSSINGADCGDDDSIDACSAFFAEMSKHFVGFQPYKATSNDYYWPLNHSSKAFLTNKWNINFASGQTILNFRFYKVPQVSSHSNATYTKIGQFTIDVNGYGKPPNTNGRDVLNMNIADDGRLIPWYGREESLFVYGDLSKYWKNVPTACGNVGVADAETVSTYGTGCTARLMDNGWMMDY